jgi:hypothetical protein
MLVVELEQAKVCHGDVENIHNSHKLPTKLTIDHQPTCNQKERSPVFLQTSKESSFSQ